MPLKAITRAALAAALCLSACGTDSTGVSRECEADDDCTNGTCVSGACVDLLDTAGDAERDAPDATGDAAVDDADTGAPPDVDADAEDDVDGEDDGELCARTFQCPCTVNADCDSDFCIPTDEGSVCTARCTETCPDPSWECRLIRGTGGDLVSICVPAEEILCEPCSSDIDCGGLDDLCVPVSDGRHCGQDCRTNDCPEGFICAPFERAGGRAQQCVPEVDVCGGCVDADGDGYGVGPTCMGIDCDDLDPARYEGAPEFCDGKDNDCDGFIDEGFDLENDRQHCGACNAVCAPTNASAICDAGTCTITSCEEGWGDCDGSVTTGCETRIDTSLAHCGACDAQCAFANAIAMCAEFECTLDACRPGFGDCNINTTDGCETDMRASLDHCGGCGNVCAFANAASACAGGSCSMTGCDDGFVDCNLSTFDGCEINVRRDTFNCGECGNVCSLTNTVAHSCVDGGCGIAACANGWSSCDGDPATGCETRTALDLDNCGACGEVCSTVGGFPSCVGGECRIDGCEGTFRDCNLLAEDGCEVNIATDAANCGLCGLDCDKTNVADLICSGGLCEILECDFGFEDCNLRSEDGCEQDIASSLTHCGGCNQECAVPNAVMECDNGTCRFIECLPGWVNLDGSMTTGCEYNCTFVAARDLPDDTFTDANCDGVDGEVSRSVFVSGSGSNGNTGLDPRNPVATIARGLEIALGDATRDHVLVATGTYTGGRLTVPSGVSVFGGYAPDFRTRSNSRVVYDSSATTAARVLDAGAPVQLDRINFVTRDQPEGSSTVAMVISNSADNVTLSNVDIVAGRGGDGNPGSPGDAGQGGAVGANGSGTTGGLGGATPGGAVGGRGGDGRNENGGTSGGTGAANGSPGGGSGGSGGGLQIVCVSPAAGSPGGDGQQGSAGTHGAGAVGAGSFDGLVWTPPVAGAGTAGGSGGSGGGGGGGGACWFGDATGRGGGGGGGGGSGGQGGLPGQGGGASVALLISNSVVAVSNVVVSTNGGGNGGAGGNGGIGGGGMRGGLGATTSNLIQGNGGNGGAGGVGGSGGCGGGGMGGPSVGVWGLGTASIVGETPDIVAGPSGAGGSSCQNAGAAGTQAETVSIALP